MSTQWLNWAKRIQALSQSGLAFSKDIYDIERYEELRKISVEIIAEYTNLEMNKIEGLFTNETGYQTPKVDVRGVVFKNDQLLMVREKIDDKWALPGGFCDIELSPTENVVKEIKEESGYDVIPVKLIALLDKNKHPHPPEPYHYYKVFILCEIIGGEPAVGPETNQVKFFSKNNLPPLSINRNTESQITTMFEFLRDPEKETVFD
ncbi:NUDIX hydrolase [Sporosarcina highlanderae]|uniref:NUDIX hydrolase n=1 Tax=Sporosarcina highlanderae TaxID=3035916 RepID=A0ABT8JN23_9BACL|nr:NUDIX hydrolase [Sporosarcina highlanderae]MDN4606447.1 NUDIX hydrolase [Sporosarcina highlanderae]